VVVVVVASAVVVASVAVTVAVNWIASTKILLMSDLKTSKTLKKRTL